MTQRAKWISDNPSRPDSTAGCARAMVNRRPLIQVRGGFIGVMTFIA
jgi:hypothetical protein